MSETSRSFVLGKVTLIRPDDSIVWANVEIPMVAISALSVHALSDRYIVPAAISALQQLQERAK
jgi:hypothetical protein